MSDTSTHLNRRAALALSFGAIGATALPTGLAASRRSDDGAAHKINLAGRQRMLSQRMTMAALFAKLNVEQTRHFEMLDASCKLFDTTLVGLRAGSAELELPEERNQLVLESLSAVDSLWETFGPTVEATAAARTVSDDALETMATLNTSLLFTADNVVKRLVSEYGNDTIDLGLAIAVNVSGRQRMLSQKMAKEAGMIALGIETEDNRRILGDTAQLFDSSLEALLNGLPDVMLPTPPDHIRLKLLEVRSVWSDYGSIMRRIADGGEVGTAQLFSVAAQTDPILSTMNDAVKLYEKHAAA